MTLAVGQSQSKSKILLHASFSNSSNGLGLTALHLIRRQIKNNGQTGKSRAATLITTFANRQKLLRITRSPHWNLLT
jgi:hypothetical protein